MNLDDFENKLIRYTDKMLIDYLMRIKLLKCTFLCLSCDIKMIFVNYADVKDNYCWRCMNKDCSSYKNRKNIRAGSFF